MKGEGHLTKMIKAETPHFFKIVLASTISQGNLSIPRMFVKRFGKYLSEKAFLKVCSGSKWQVDVVRIGDHVHFSEGWQQFVDYYSISHGSFLVFGFQDFKTCCFNVTIFDKTASEIDYPFNIEEQLHDKAAPEMTESEESDEPCKKIQKEAFTGQPRRNTKHLKHKEMRCFRAMNDLNKFTTVNPYFKVNLRPCYLKHHHLKVPINFMAKCKNQNVKKAMLKIEDRVWPVKLIRNPSNGTFTLSAGISAFFNDNSLQVGDVCVFELIDSDNLQLKVFLFR